MLSLDSDRFKVSLLFDEVHVSFVDELADPGADLVVTVPGVIGAIRSVFARYGVTCDGDCGWYDSRHSGSRDVIGWVGCPGCPACGAEPADRLIIIAPGASLERRLRDELGAVDADSSVREEPATPRT